MTNRRNVKSCSVSTTDRHERGRGFQARQEMEVALKHHFEYYNHQRLHQAFDYFTSAHIYYGAG